MDLDEMELFTRDGITTRGTRFHVDFNFCCNLSVYEYYGNVLVGVNRVPYMRCCSIPIGMDELMRHDESLEMIDEELRGWPILCVHENEWRDLIERTLAHAYRVMESMPPEHNVLVIPYRIEIGSHRAVDALELAAQLSMQEADCGMVPATYSSIESLEMKTCSEILKDQTCSICLEDFYSGCEVVSMPCSHVFHQDCIKKWLKSSHYCPICRFQMPSSSA